jgi:hypothetical protein
VCIELLSETSLIPNRNRDETRELAAQYLGELASSDAALFLLEGTAKSSGLRNSKRVRDAAQAALDRLKQRAQEALERKAERKQQAAGTIAGQRTGAKSSAQRTSSSDPRKKSSASTTSQAAVNVAPPVSPPTAANDNSADPNKTGAGTGRVAKPGPNDKPGGATRQARSRS